MCGCCDDFIQAGFRPRVGLAIILWQGWSTASGPAAASTAAASTATIGVDTGTHPTNASYSGRSIRIVHVEQDPLCGCPRDPIPPLCRIENAHLPGKPYEDFLDSPSIEFLVSLHDRVEAMRGPDALANSVLNSLTEVASHGLSDAELLGDLFGLLFQHGPKGRIVR